jgi:uncharacterized protein YbjT (DUF2867 family)
MNRVLVAGATGYLGRFVAREFKRRGDWVRVLARSPDKLKTPRPFLEPAVAGLVDDVFVGEVTRPGTLRGLCEGIEVVFSSIGITRQTDRWWTGHPRTYSSPTRTYTCPTAVYPWRSVRSTRAT